MTDPPHALIERFFREAAESEARWTARRPNRFDEAARRWREEEALSVDLAQLLLIWATNVALSAAPAERSAAVADQHQLKVWLDSREHPGS